MFCSGSHDVGAWLLLLGCLPLVTAIRPEAGLWRETKPVEATPSAEEKIKVTCPIASETVPSRLDFELEFRGATNFNPYTNYTLHAAEDCRTPLEQVAVTVFPILNSTEPLQSKVAVVLGDELLLQPDLKMPLYICGAPRSANPEDTVPDHCFCQLTVRKLKHTKPIRRRLLEWPLESWNMVSDTLLTSMAAVLESKLWTYSSKRVRKARNMREVRLSMLRRLEDVDQTYNTSFCPVMLDTFDKLYLFMGGILIILLGLLGCRLRRDPKTWYPRADKAAEVDEDSQALKVDGPHKLCKSWLLQMFAFVGFILTLQGVGIRFISSMRFLPFMIVTTWLVGLLEICRMFQCFCQAQLVHAALQRGLHVQWTSSSFTSSAFTSLVDDVAAILATAMVCAMIMFCAAYYGSADGMLSAAAMAIWPAVMGIAKSLVFLQEKDLTLQQSLMPTSVPELFRVLQQDPDNAGSLEGTLDKALCKEELRTVKMRTFLKCCRHDQNPVNVGQALQGNEPRSSLEEDPKGHASFRVFRDMRWHGRVVYRLTGSRAVWLNPLILFAMLALISCVSLVRLGIVSCTPPSVQFVEPVDGMLAPNFTFVRMRYAWLRWTHSEVAKMTFEKAATMNLSSPPASSDRSFWKQMINTTETNWTVQSTQFGEMAKTYSIMELPVRIMPTTVVLRYSGYEQCLWFSMLKAADSGGTPVSIPDEAELSNLCNRSAHNGSCKVLELAVSFREIMLSVPINDAAGMANSSLREPFTTVCETRRNESCHRSCELDPRCLLSQHYADSCCFVWTDVRNTTACWAESKGVLLTQRRITLANWQTHDTGVTGHARLHFPASADEAGRYVRIHHQKWNSSVLNWSFDVTHESLEGYELELYELGDVVNPTPNAFIHFSSGMPQLAQALIAVEKAEQDVDDIRVVDASSSVKGLHYHLKPIRKRFRLATSGTTRTAYIIPLLADRSITYDLGCACGHLQAADRRKGLFIQRCHDTELARWYDVCGGPFPTQIMTVPINILQPQVTQPVEVVPAGNFRSKFMPTISDVTVWSDFMENLTGQELISDGCVIQAHGYYEIFQVPFACAVFRSDCKNISIMLTYGSTKELPVLAGLGESSFFSELQAFMKDRTARGQLALCAADHPGFLTSFDFLAQTDLDFLDVARADKVTAAGKNGRTLAARMLHQQLKKAPKSAPALLLDVLDGGTSAMLQVVVDGIAASASSDSDPRASALFAVLLQLLESGQRARSELLLRAVQDSAVPRYFQQLGNAVAEACVQTGASDSFARTLLALHVDALLAPTHLALDFHSDGLLRFSTVLQNLTSLQAMQLTNVSGNNLQRLEMFLAKMPSEMQSLSIPRSDFSKMEECWKPLLSIVGRCEKLQRLDIQGMVPPKTTSLAGLNGTAMNLGSHRMSLNLADPNLAVLHQESHSFHGYLEALQTLWAGTQLTALNIGGWRLEVSFGKHADQHYFAFRKAAQQLKVQEALHNLTFSCTARVYRDWQDGHCNCNEKMLINFLDKSPSLRHLAYGLDIDPRNETKLVTFEGPGGNDIFVNLTEECDLCRSSAGLEKMAAAIFERQTIQQVSLTGHAYQLIHYIHKASSITKLRIRHKFADPNSTEAWKLTMQVALYFPELELLDLSQCKLNSSICAATRPKSFECIV